MNKIELGDKVRSKVSGFTGKVTAICHYLYSETMVQVTSTTLNSDGKENKIWFNPTELEKKD